MLIQLGGTVTVQANTERWLSEVRAGRAFALGVGQAAVAGEKGFVQLVNPAASGINVLVRSVIATLGVAGHLHIRHHTAGVDTDNGAGVNMLIGGAAGVAHLFVGTDVGLLGTALFNIRLAADTPIYPTPDWFAELGAGESLLVQCADNNVAVWGNFAWIELA
jgi:hypothetical protein